MMRRVKAAEEAKTTPIGCHAKRALAVPEKALETYIFTAISAIATVPDAQNVAKTE